MGLYWPNFSLVFLIHLFLYTGVYCIPFSILGHMKLQFSIFFCILLNEAGIVLHALKPSLEVKRYIDWDRTSLSKDHFHWKIYCLKPQNKKTALRSRQDSNLRGETTSIRHIKQFTKRKRLKCPYHQNFYFPIWSYISCNEHLRKNFSIWIKSDFVMNV